MTNITKIGGEWLCQAWGETDRPAVAIVKTRDKVQKFIVDQWLGSAEDQDLPDIMRQFDNHDWGDGDLVWNFEIGGVSISDVDAAAGLKPHVSSMDYGMFCIKDDAPARPDLLERLTYHQHERDDMTLDELLETLANGYTTVHQRTYRQLELQLLALLAAGHRPWMPLTQDELVALGCQAMGAPFSGITEPDDGCNQLVRALELNFMRGTRPVDPAKWSEDEAIAWHNAVSELAHAQAVSA